MQNSKDYRNLYNLSDENELVVYILGIGISQKRSIKSWLFRKFEPIRPNPYIAGNPIRSKKMFFGREDVFYFIKERLSVRRKNIAIFLYGERKIGNTSIFYQIENGRLGKEFVPVYIDVQEMPEVNEREFFATIAEKTTESLVKFQVVGPKSNEYSEINQTIKEYETGKNPYNVFNNFLDKAMDVLKEKYLIAMFDEYELLWEKVNSNRISSDLIRYMRHLMQDRERLAFIFTGSRGKLKSRDKEWDLMLGGVIPRKVSFLDKKAALDLMSDPVDNKILYNKKATNKLLRLTARQPFFLQLFLQNLIDYVNEVKKYRVKVEDINHVLHYILNNPPPHLSFIWKDSTHEQQMVLSALAEIIKSEDQYVSVKEVKEKLPEKVTTGYRKIIRLDEKVIGKALNDLTYKEILECKKGETAYNFRIDFLRYWVENEHPLFRAIEDIEREIKEEEK